MSPRLLLRAASPYLGLTLVTVLAYAQVYAASFVWLDDDVYVFQNPIVQGGLSFEGARWAFTTFAVLNWHPLTWLSHMLDWQLYGGFAGGHHATSVALHVVATLTLYRVLRELTPDTGRSLFVAGLFALHPLHVESVAWVSERKDVLSTSLGLLAVWSYVRHARRPSFASFALVGTFHALSLMAKPLFVTLPFVLLLLDRWPLARVGAGRDARWGRLAVEKLPLLMLSAVSSVLTLASQEAGGAVVGMQQAGLAFRVLNACYAYTTYLEKTLWPVDLAVFYPLTRSGLSLGRGLLSMLLLGVFTLAALRWLRTRPAIAVGWFWFLGVLVPMIGLIQVGEQFVADRYMYVPLVGLGIVAAWGFDASIASRVPASVRAVGAVAILAACFAVTWVQVGTWRNSFTLFERALAVEPDNEWAHVGIGRAHQVEGNLARARDHYARALDLRPQHSIALEGLAVVQLGLEEYYEAESAYRRLVALRPDRASAQYGLGMALDRQRRPNEAAAHFREALRLDPSHAGARARLAELEGS